jgi:hypothetical protein
MLVYVSSSAPSCFCNGCEQCRQARIHHPNKYKNVEQWTANAKVFRCFFVTDNKGENYKTTNNTNAWPSGSPYFPASSMTEDNGLAPPPLIGHRSRGMKRQAAPPAIDSDSNSDSDDDGPHINKPPKCDVVSLEVLRQSVNRLKGEINAIKNELMIKTKEHHEAATEVLTLKAALEAANAEKNDSAVDYWCVGEELEASLARIVKMYIELMYTWANISHVTIQFQNKAREYDDVGLELLGVTTKYRDTLTTIKENQQKLAMMASELVVARNMLSETALFAELMKEELF